MQTTVEGCTFLDHVSGEALDYLAFDIRRKSLDVLCTATQTTVPRESEKNGKGIAHEEMYVSSYIF